MTVLLYTLIHITAYIHKTSESKENNSLNWTKGKQNESIKFTTITDVEFLVGEKAKKELGEKNETHIGEQPTQSKLEHTHKQKQMWIKNNHYREWHGFARDFFWNHLPFIPVKESYEYERD